MFIDRVEIQRCQVVLNNKNIKFSPHDEIILFQVYISEIADPTIRASLCSAAKVLSHIGLLSSFALGAFLDWRQLACVCAGSPIMLFITSR